MDIGSAADDAAFNSLKDYTGCILAGGMGTRLKPCLHELPKPLAPVNGRPFLDYLLCQLEQAGLRHCILCTGYRSEAMEKQYGSSFGDMKLTYSCEPRRMGTGGALRLVHDLLDDKPIIVSNGDSFFDIDLSVPTGEFLRSSRKAMMLLRYAEDVGRYGSVVVDSEGRVSAFEEKSAGRISSLINAGIYFFRKSAVAAIVPGVECSLEHDVFPQFVSRGELYGLRADGTFIDIGTPESYREAQQLAKAFTTCDFSRHSPSR